MSRFSQRLAISILAGIVATSAVANEAARKSARDTLAAANAAFAGGRYPEAVEALSAALPDLGMRESAKAFYLRARAYRAMGKPGRAISDFDNALAATKGLSAAERRAAKQERKLAYAEAGLTEQELALSGEEPIVLIAPQASSIVTGALHRPRAPLDGWNAEAASEATKEPPKAPPATPFATQVTAAPKPPEESPAPTPWQMTAVAAPAPAPAAPAPAVWQGAMEVTAAPAAAPARTQAPAAAAPTQTDMPVAPAGSAAPAPADLPGAREGTAATDASVHGDVRGATGAAASGPAPAAPAPAQTEPESNPSLAALSSASEQTTLNLGTVRSQSEAYALTVRAVSLLGHRVNGGRLSIAAVDGGNAFRVRLGPYADYELARSICEQLRTTSFDCTVDAGAAALPSAATTPVDVAELPPLSSPRPGAPE